MRVVSATRGTRTIGRNEVPAEVWVDNIDDAVELLETGEAFTTFREVIMLPTHGRAPQWGYEDSPVRRDLPPLTADERALYDDLRDNVFRSNLRLEQEITSYGLVEVEVQRLTAAASDQPGRQAPS